MQKRSFLWAGFLAIALSFAPTPASAMFHLWTIREVYSNADGSIQYVELTTSSDFQNVLAGHNLTATSDGSVVTFTFGSSLGSTSTGGHRLLIATPGFAALP